MIDRSRMAQEKPGKRPLLAALAMKGPASIDENAVRSAYRRWAPVYDTTFGVVAGEGRKHSVEIINQTSGRVLEVGVGTGLSLPMYKKSLEIVGIDLSPEMLEKARERMRWMPASSNSRMRASISSSPCT
jgi:SAM-dependent methyltransferase